MPIHMSRVLPQTAGLAGRKLDLSNPLVKKLVWIETLLLYWDKLPMGLLQTPGGGSLARLQWKSTMQDPRVVGSILRE
jgi:hypothetical protein